MARAASRRYCVRLGNARRAANEGTAFRTMKVLVVGGGGGEHALCWKVAPSPLTPGIVCAPGNPGTAKLGRNVPVQATDVPGLVELAKREKPDLVVVGPEDPLVAGLADKLRAFGFPVFGPGAKGARLEGSKVFAKELL